MLHWQFLKNKKLKNPDKTYIFSLFLFIPLIAAACASTVSFEVHHPPVVDLRNVGTITVIPFEWNNQRGYERLARNVTSALINGVRRADIAFIDPHILQGVSRSNYWRFVDVYIIGSIVDARVDIRTETREELQRNRTVRRIITHSYELVTIEYSYIRSVNNEVLGRFRKTETNTVISEQTRGPRSRQASDDFMRRDPGRGRGRRAAGNISDSTVAQFSNTMSHELSPWTSTEKRNIRGTTRNNPLMAEAKRLVRQEMYDEALEIYQAIYEQDGSLFAGYNTAILLVGINEQFTEALALLEILHRELRDSGKRVPSFLSREIRHMKGFIEGFRILQEYRTNR